MRLPLRLSPKAVFVGLVALGLPFAVTVGWTLGVPMMSAPSPSVAAPGGSGSIGQAPARDQQPAEPVNPVRYGNRAPAPSSAAASATSIAPPAPPVPSTSPAGGAPIVTISGIPPLTDPPVPTPTTVTSAPPSPSATPSASTSSEPSLGLLRRR